MQEAALAICFIIMCAMITFLCGLSYNLFQVVYRFGRMIGDWGMCKEENDD